MSLSDNRPAINRRNGTIETMGRKVYRAKHILLIILLLAAFNASPKTAVAPAFAEESAGTESLHVASIEPVYVERGASTYMVTIRAHVINNGTSENVAIDVAGKDEDGFILQNVRFTGTIAPGKSRMLMERFQVRGETYEKISTWEVRR